MDTGALQRLKRKILVVFPSTFVLMGTLLFLPAGSFFYWQAWLFCLVLFVPALFVVCYFLRKSPEFLARRMSFEEKETKHKAIIKIANVIFFLGMLIPGFDFRFGWSAVPTWLVVASDIVILAAYSLVFLAFRENPYAARTVEVFEGHKVIDTGPYAVVRHPMYAGVIPMYLFLPLALGSFVALLAFVPVCGIVILRALDEEEILKRGLPGYGEYCQKVRYRLIPHVW